MNKYVQLIEKIKLCITKYEKELEELHREYNIKEIDEESCELDLKILKNELEKNKKDLDKLKEYEGKNVYLHTSYLIIKEMAKEIRGIFKNESNFFGIIYALFLAMGPTLMLGIFIDGNIFTIISSLVVIGIGIYSALNIESHDIRKLRKDFDINALEEIIANKEQKELSLNEKINKDNDRESEILKQIKDIEQKLKQSKTDLETVEESRFNDLVNIVSDSELNASFDKTGFDDIIKRTRDKKEGE